VFRSGGGGGGGWDGGWKGTTGGNWGGSGTERFKKCSVVDPEMNSALIRIRRFKLFWS